MNLSNFCNGEERILLANKFNKKTIELKIVLTSSMLHRAVFHWKYKSYFYTEICKK